MRLRDCLSMDTSLIAPAACLAITATSAFLISTLHRAKAAETLRASDLATKLEYERKVHRIHADDLDEKISFLRVERDALKARLNEIKRITSGAMLRDPKTGKVTGRADW